VLVTSTTHRSWRWPQRASAITRPKVSRFEVSGDSLERDHRAFNPADHRDLARTWRLKTTIIDRLKQASQPSGSFPHLGLGRPAQSRPALLETNGFVTTRRMT
jgi:hypothetical protein